MKQLCIRCSFKTKKDVGIQTDTSKPEKDMIRLQSIPSNDGEVCIYDSSGRFYLYFIRDPDIYNKITKGENLYSPLLIHSFLISNPDWVWMLNNLIMKEVFWYTAQFDETFSNGLMRTKRKVFLFYFS